ncbi:MAG TPA: PHP domain-containing protein [Clostridia bacterium]|nr:PHP domain-containing protein [Clostridia bacterium]
MRTNSLIDLHTHTVFSDGEYSPEELIDLAKASGVGFLSITDHDTLAGYFCGREKANNAGIKLLPGVEFSSNFDKELHILGYNFDPKHVKLNAELARLEHDRTERFREMIARLRKMGINIEPESGKPGTLGRMHIARALVRRGVVGSIDEAFGKYLDRGKPVYVEGRKLSCREIIELIVSAGGIAVLAHPKSLEMQDVEFNHLLRALVGYGLKGLEVYYPTHTLADVDHFKRICIRYGLVATAGTDYHGPSRDTEALGGTSRDYNPSDSERIALGLI